ncbi:MAG: response regulator [Campylobacterota bacterium]|nr:response regulator [Campylobacterota bacterium]
MNQEIKELKEKVKNLNILYCEDEDEMRMGSELFLNKFFTSVDSAKDGEEGLNKFKEKSYQVVFTDIMMPNMDGLEMLKNMKEINKDIFTVTLTASEVKEDEIRESSNLYFRKPITYENMITVMGEIVKKFNL